MIRQILQGVRGPQRDIVVLNAGAAIVAGGGTQDIQEGIKAAKRSVESGTAWEKLEKVVAFCKQ